MYREKRIGAIVVAAGSGSRMGGNVAKQYRKIGGEMVFLRSVRALNEHPLIDDLFVVVKESDVNYCRGCLDGAGSLDKVRMLIPGGKERKESAQNGLRGAYAYWERMEIPAPRIILVHDAARPFLSEEVVDAVVRGADESGAAVPVIPLKDTVRSGEGTLDRSKLFAVQTPQGFDAELLRKAYKQADKDGVSGTDDASLTERLGVRTALVTGDYGNFKITTEEDLIWAEAMAKRLRTGGQAEELALRVGIGYDVHAFAPERKMILGGVRIDYPCGLAGHSDADVLTHAIMDALFGACGLGDIGRYFPDSDEAFKGISSLKLLRRTVGLLRESGFEPVNIDAVLIGERPKIGPYAKEMKKTLSKELGIEESQINIKGTTTEKLGFCGRGEGLAAQAVALCRTI